MALHQWLSITILLRALSFLSPNLQTTKMMMLHSVVHLNGFETTYLDSSSFDRPDFRFMMPSIYKSYQQLHCQF